ncbi:MAG: hypothetical protein E6K55_07165, partial [Gemmatimonadetes bacterium]
MTRRLAFICPLGALALLACGGSPSEPPAAGDSLRLQLVASGLSSPVYLSAPPGDTERLFIVEQ